MDASEIRRIYTQFFVERGHQLVASASLVAARDRSLLFTSAGMVPFKPYFLGTEQPPSPRLTSVQKCFRTTDIDEVGDASHLTMFEMLGNFSIGDYFKPEAQAWAWELVTDRLQIPAERLVTTVFTDDDDAFANWRKLGLPEDRIFRYGADQGNYWYAGDEGPCGPCSEIHYDLRPGDGPLTGPADDPGRWLEIWNLVFTQFTRDRAGALTPLPQQHIDTGAGLERWAMMLQDKASVYETDLFAPLLGFLGGRSAREYASAGEHDQRALRVIAEHGRAVTFLISDGVMPSNEGSGYVLRRLIRRALYMAQTLGIDEPLLVDLAGEVRTRMGDWYPEIVEQAALTDGVLAREERRFRTTLATGHQILGAAIGLKNQISEIVAKRTNDAAYVDEAKTQPEGIGRAMQVLERSFDEMSVASAALRTPQAIQYSGLEAVDGARDRLENEQESIRESPGDFVRDALADAAGSARQISGAEAFTLYDTYGFPPELTREVASQAGLAFDQAGFDAAMEAQRERGRAGASFADELQEAAYAEIAGASAFSGYDRTRDTGLVRGIVVEGESRAQAERGATVEVVLDRTPFYAEGGGQMGDAGRLVMANGEVTVRDTQARGDLIAHLGEVTRGAIAVGDEAEAQVDLERRHNLMRNHTATHLLHAALRASLGDHVRQAGSLVAPDRLRFDYTQPEAPTAEQLAAVEQLVRARIRDDIAVGTNEMPYEEALDYGATAIFGEKYATAVRVVEICDPAPEAQGCFSKELCGGIHASATGFIGGFQIVSEGSVGAGLRRIEALTGAAAEGWQGERLGLLNRVATLLKSEPADAPARVEALQAELSEAKRRLARWEREASVDSAAALAEAPEDVDGVSVVTGRLDVESADALRQVGDEVRRRLGSGVIVLGAVAGERPVFVAMVTDDLVKRGLHAGKLMKEVAKIAGGGGGGKPGMAQAGGKDAGQLDAALAVVAELVRQQGNG